jgi:hypothetical protein
MKSKMNTFVLAVILTLCSSPVFSMVMTANSYVYFDAQGNVVGQSIMSCGNQARQAAGVTSQYWRQDSYNCDSIALTGAHCIWQASAPPDTEPEYNLSGGIYPIGGSVCQAEYTTTQTSVDLHPLNYLPPGMTLEQSCNIATCDGVPDKFLGIWTSVSYDYTNSSLPPQLR